MWDASKTGGKSSRSQIHSLAAALSKPLRLSACFPTPACAPLALETNSNVSLVSKIRITVLLLFVTWNEGRDS